MVAFPCCVAFTSLAVFGTLAVLGLIYLPPRLERGFDLLTESDLDSATLLGAFEAASAGNREVSQRLNGSSISTYRLFDLVLTYQLRDSSLNDGMFDARVVDEIAGFERGLRATPQWSSLCGTAEDQDRPLCDPGVSLVNYIRASVDIRRGELLPRSVQFDGRSVEAVPLEAALHAVRSHRLEGIILPWDVLAAHANRSSPMVLRSIFRFRLRCAGCDGHKTSPDVEQLQGAWERLVEDSVLPAMEASWSRETQSLVRVDVSGTGLREIQHERALARDAALAAGVAAVPFLYLVWHTRSVLLSFAAVCLAIMALPLSYSLFALLSGSAEVGSLFLASAFCGLGVGVDAALVYSDTWRESARKRGSELERLKLTFRIAGWSTVVTSVVLSLTFLAALASVARHVREFGVFTAICIMVTWILATVLLAPLCMLTDRHCAACRFHAPPSSKVAEVGGSVVASTWVRVLPGLRRLRCPACLLPVLASVASCYIALWQAKLSMVAPEPLPKGHPTRRGEQVAQEFVEATSVFGTGFAVPPRTAEVCSGHDFGAEDAERCGFFWCEAVLQASPPIDDNCTCYRRERTGCGQRADADVHLRVAGLPLASDADLIAAAGAFLAADAVATGLSAPRRRSNSGLPALRSAGSSLAPLLLEDISSGGRPSFAALAQVRTSFARRNLTSSSCGWDDLCFCSRQACRLPRGIWREVPVGFQPPTPLVAMSAPSRPTALDERPLVHVVFGLKVPRDLPFLGARDGDAAWSFDGYFDPRQTAAQIDLRALCQGLPAELRVAERRCWIDDFAAFLDDRQERFPVPFVRFGPLFDDYVRLATTGMGSGSSSSRSAGYLQHLWLRDGQLKACSMAFALDVSRTLSRADAFELKRHWDAHLQRFDDVASVYAHGAFHISELWVEAEVQGAMLSTMGLVAGIAMVAIFVSTALVTRSLLLPLYVVVAAAGTLCGALFFVVVVLRWAIGPLEVVALSAVAGQAAHGAVRVAVAYSSSEALSFVVAAEELDARSAVRLRRTGYALAAAASSVCGTSLALAACSAFLALCQLSLFRRLGVVAPVLLLLSAFNALVPLPAGLLMCGPAFLTQKRWLTLREACGRAARSGARCVRRAEGKGKDSPDPSGQQQASAAASSELPNPEPRPEPSPAASSACGGPQSPRHASRLSPRSAAQDQDELNEPEGLNDKFVSTQAPIPSRGRCREAVAWTL